MTPGVCACIYFDDGTLLGVSSIVNYNDPGSIDSNPGRPGAMSNGVGPGERVGLHVQGFADGGSLSLVNEPMPLTPVRLPAAGPLLLGVVGLGRFIRRRQS